MSKYCPIITKALENHQNQTYCLEEDCAWWPESEKLGAVVGIACQFENPIQVRQGKGEQE